MAGEVRLSFRTFGRAGADRLVVLVGLGDSVVGDPAPSITASRVVRVVAVTLDRGAIDDPGTFGGATPAEQTAAALADLVRDQLRVDTDDRTANPADEPDAAGGDPTAGVIAYHDVADVVLRAVARLGHTVDRLALVAVPAPAEPLDRDDLAEVMASVPAKTLILNGQKDEAAGNAAATWFRDNLASARVEMLPGVTRVSLADVWARVLSHLAPGRTR